jgi:hypothetical protein
MSPSDVIIIGAGLAGLCCASHLRKAGVSFRIFEASDGIGGRVRTDSEGGYLFDRGFQVFSTAYPEPARILDYPALRLQPFFPGARVWFGGRFHQLSDPFRHPVQALGGLLNPIGSTTDKLRIAVLRRRACAGSLESLFDRPDRTTLEHLREQNFSNEMVDRFFRPFLGGIFLERELVTSSRQFEFVFRMFAQGHATVPACGMGEIPRQLAADFAPDSILLNAKVVAIDRQTVRLADGETHSARAIVLAVDRASSAGLLPTIADPGSLEVQCHYFGAPQGKSSLPILHLDGTGDGPINNLAFVSDIAPEYAPPGRRLVSATVLGGGNVPISAIQTQLLSWFGPEAATWEYLKSYRIRGAQPRLVGPLGAPGSRPARIRDGLFICGDYWTNVSIHGAMLSGRFAAEAVLEQLGCKPTFRES